MFERLEALPDDAILKLIAEYRDDPRAQKIDLGVGVYRDEQGRTPILDSVKEAERRIVREQQSKAYLGSGGDPVVNAALQELIFGVEHGASERITTLHTPGGSGALRVAAGLLLRAGPEATVWVSEPTWNNHVPLLGGAGLQLDGYPYYAGDTHRVQFTQMLDALHKMPDGDIVLLHGCCHNPTGMDLSHEQWREVAAVIAARNLLPFVDMAYQGFAEDLEADAWPVRLLFDTVPEMLVASSCSKNFGLYRDRIGSLSLVSRDAATSAVVRSQAHNIVRTLYSVPPDHGSAIVAQILGDTALHESWLLELKGMRERLQSMRSLLVSALHEHAPAHDFSHIELANGLFCYLGVTTAQVARLKADYAIYLVGSGRINVAGITPGNVDYLAASVAAVL
ncbi:MAG: aspartate/tyrosine/aromatic aminotransferase [Gammaproteobacteria bacterium]|nr:MAG: aspartate/tyrosine/aromatic aminotransferase [Gammaproteobacteria bacterium]